MLLLGVWWHTPFTKSVKAYSPEIVSGSNFDEIYEAVKLMVGSYPPHPPPGAVPDVVHDMDVYRYYILYLSEPIVTVTVRTVWLHTYIYTYSLTLLQ